MFEQHALALLEVSTRAQVLNIGLQRWLALQLEYLGALMLLCVAMLTVACRSSSALGLSGLALTYALTLTALGKYLVNYAARADAQVRTHCCYTHAHSHTASCTQSHHQEVGLASTPWRLYFRLGATAHYYGPAAGVP